MVTLTPSPKTVPYWAHREKILGAFLPIDFLLFDRILDAQERRSVEGNLLEIGAFLGKSAIVLGLHSRGDEQVIICDIFENPGAFAENAAENAASYPGLTREQFESNYTSWTGRTPTVVPELSTNIRQYVPDSSIRFAHIDGGHLFEVVSADVANAHSLLNEDGIVVIDDFRAIHTPGVAAAVWQAVTRDGLIPVCVSEQKFYGAWSESTAEHLHDELAQWFEQHSTALHFGRQNLLGHETLIVANPTIRTPRQRVGHLLPPAVKELLRGRPAKPYLGS